MLPAIFAYFILGITLSKSLGNYELGPVLGAFAGWLTFLRQPRWKVRWPIERILLAVVIANLIRLFFKPAVLYFEPKSELYQLQILIALALLFSLFLKMKVGFFCALACLFLLRLKVLWGSPAPHIDVFSTTNLASDYFLSGKNPYSFLYPDIYAGASGYPAGFLYPPGVLYWVATFKKLFGDIRYGFLISDFIVSGSFYFILRKHSQRAALFSLLWLSFPVSLLILEQAWVDTLLIQWTLLFWIALQYRRTYLAAAFLGIALVTKQYAILLGPLTWVYLRKNGAPTKTRLRFFLIAFLIFGASCSPFLMNDFQGTWNTLMVMPLKQAIRFDSFSLVALFHNEFQYDLKTSLISMINLVGLGALLFVAMKKERFSELDWAFFHSLLYGLLFFVSKQAFCNYYQWLSMFLLLYLAKKLESPNAHT